MQFRVADASKALVAVMAVVRIGNRVVLEDGPGRSYFEKLRTCDRVLLRESGGALVFVVSCPTGLENSDAAFQ